MAVTPSPSSDDEIIGYFYTAKITLRDGRILYAHQVGKKAFRIPIRRKDKRRGKKA